MMCDGVMPTHHVWRQRVFNYWCVCVCVWMAIGPPSPLLLLLCVCVVYHIDRQIDIL